MRLRNMKNKNEILTNCPFLVVDGKKYKGHWCDYFGNSHEIRIEIGMGKGKFLLEEAMNHPEVNFIGIDRFDNVLARAILKIKPLPNLCILRCNAIELNEYFHHEISLIYLNFSDPWPKDRHSKRRLTSPSFLSIYEQIFENMYQIKMKTDNRKLFEYSIISFTNDKYKIEELSLNLHQDEYDMPITEYEENFIKKGYPIYYVFVSK